MCAQERENKKKRRKETDSQNGLIMFVTPFFLKQCGDCMSATEHWVAVTCYGACVLMFLDFYLRENKHHIVDL